MRGILRQQPGSHRPTVTTDFEVRCDDCDVTYPAETKRCMYCGGRPGHRPLFAREVADDPLDDIGPSSDSLRLDDLLRRADAPIGEQEVEQPRRSIFRLFGNLSWVILFAALTLYRACTG